MYIKFISIKTRLLFMYPQEYPYQNSYTLTLKPNSKKTLMRILS